MSSCGKYLFVVFVLFAGGCVKDNTVFISDLGEQVLFDTYYANPPGNENDTTSICLDRDHPAIVAMRKRAYQIATIEWTPVTDLLETRKKGKTISGIPYSSVKELNKFVGQEVSFHTFMTAVHNPRSVLYTEDVSLPPYNGTNCRLYYGTVCSMAVNYALGIERPYWTGLYSQLASFQRVARQNFAYCAPGDVIWTKGHVVLIIDVIRNDAGDVKTIEILESVGTLTRVYSCSVSEAKQRWKDDEFILYRYKYLSESLNYRPNQYVPVFDEINEVVTYNDDLCLSRGDQACFHQGEEVIINIFSDDYSALELYRNDAFYDSYTVSGKDFTLPCLPEGCYDAYLVSESNRSEPASFEVLETNVSFSMRGGIVEIAFDSSNGFPEYIEFCSKSGGRRFISDISDEERLVGKKYIKCEKSLQGAYLKVFFRGQYGRVSNEMIPLI